VYTAISKKVLVLGIWFKVLEIRLCVCTGASSSIVFTPLLLSSFKDVTKGPLDESWLKCLFLIFKSRKTTRKWDFVIFLFWRRVFPQRRALWRMPALQQHRAAPRLPGRPDGAAGAGAQRQQRAGHGRLDAAALPVRLQRGKRVVHHAFTLLMSHHASHTF